MAATCSLHNYIHLHNSQEDVNFSDIVNEQIPTNVETSVINKENCTP